MKKSKCDTIAYDNEDPDVDFKHLSTSGDDATKNNVVLVDLASIDSEKLQNKHFYTWELYSAKLITFSFPT